MGRLARLASTNEGKLRELRHALPGWQIEPLDAVEYPPEEGDTYYENARAKAVHGHTLAPDGWVLGEDSGVELEALGGEPGVRSSRWAAGRESERAIEVLAAVEGEGRGARYVSELVAISPAGEEFAGRASSRGASPRSHGAARASASTRSSSPRAKSVRWPSSATTGSARTPTELEPPERCS